MDFALRILVLVGGIIGGILLIRFSYQLTQMIGYNDLAEKYLGSGGTYTMWKLVGLLVIIVSIWWAFR